MGIFSLSSLTSLPSAAIDTTLQIGSSVLGSLTGSKNEASNTSQLAACQSQDSSGGMLGQMMQMFNSLIQGLMGLVTSLVSKLVNGTGASSATATGSSTEQAAAQTANSALSADSATAANSAAASQSASSATNSTAASDSASSTAESTTDAAACEKQPLLAILKEIDKIIQTICSTVSQMAKGKGESSKDSGSSFLSNLINGAKGIFTSIAASLL